MTNIQNGLVDLLNAIYAVKTDEGFAFKLVHKKTRDEIPIRNNSQLCKHLNTFYDWGVFSIENENVFSFTSTETDETVILAIYDKEKWTCV